MGRAPWARGAGGEEHPHFPEPSPRCKRGDNRSGPTTLAWAPSVSCFLLGLRLAPLSEDTPHPLAKAESRPHWRLPPAHPPCFAVSVCQAALPGHHTLGCDFNGKNPLSHSSAGRKSGIEVLAGWVLGRPLSSARRWPPSHHVPTQPLSCATWCLFPFYRDTSPIRRGPHP